ncbi:MAG TPA: acetyl-CoA C-acyltransferase [Solirubrobacterales bacterium]|nr:acetyl-CoA C-acyltransferase [Solirubrobacterales bacterium]
MPTPVVVATRRTPIGRAFKGSLSQARPDDLAAFVTRTLVEETEGLDPAEIEDVVCGAAIQAGPQSMNLGRIVAALAGLPETVPGSSVNRFCASSLQSVRVASHAIAAGEGDAYLAVGVECVSQVNGRAFDPERDANPRFTDPGRADYVNDMYISMGLTAENVAERWDVSREAMDEFAALSQQRALAAREAGFFAREITPVTLPDSSVVDADDGIRPGTTVEVLAGLKPAFKEDGRVTAGNSCPLNDGAAAALIMSEERARELGLPVRARVVASAVSGVAPEIMGVGPIEAARLALKRAGMSVGDLDIVELNEAFAAQVLPICDEVGIDVAEQLNPHGGAIALGHPFGMTGVRMLTTLLNGLESTGGSVGMVTMCVAGGQGMATIFERT